MASGLDDTETELLRETIRRILKEYVKQGDPACWDERSLYPKEVIEVLEATGICGLTVAEEYGGSGVNIPAALMVVEELSKVSLALAVPYIMSAFYGGMNLMECGSEEQKKRFLPDIATGKLKFAFAVTEPNVGADVASVTTTARQRGNDLIVNGRKRFITGANVADYLYTLVRTGPPEDRYRNLSILLIPRDSPGLSIEKIESIGMRGGAYTTDIVFDEVCVSREAVVGGGHGFNQGWTLIAGPGLDVERLEVSAIALGLASAALEQAWRYSQEREQFGKPICVHQSVRHTLADAQTDLLACRLMLSHAAKIAQDRGSCRTESAMSKLFVCERAKKIVLDCQMILGAYGCVRGYDMERYVRDILILPIAGGSSSIQRNNIVASLGLPR